MTAKARCAYLEAFISIANNLEDDTPSPEQIKRLHFLRITYDELVAASQALEAAIERGYLDVEN